MSNASSQADRLAQDYSQLDIQDESQRSSESRPHGNPFEKVVRAHHYARDITTDFARACKGLEVGQLVKDENFTLFESVQALEVMDPKMDSGCLEVGETLEDNYNVSAPLYPDGVVGIIDQLLSYEAAWHQGYPLSQTLFTSLHIDHLLTQKRAPNVLPTFTARCDDEAAPIEVKFLETVLQAYCIGIVKSCDIVLEMVTAQNYYEEEDLTTQTYQRDLLTDVPDQQCATLLEDACSWLRDRRKDNYTDALIVRLEARKTFVESFAPAENGTSSPVERWTAQKERYKSIRDSHHLASSVKTAFSSKMHRKLASTAPPRPPIELSFDDSIDELSRMCDDLMEASFVGIYEQNASPESIRSYLWSYSSRTPAPSTFARAALQSLLLSDGRPAGAGEIETLVLNELKESVIPIDSILDGSFWEIEVPTDPRYEVARKFDWFFERAAQPFANVFRALCQNRCRIRRFLTNILPEFDDLSAEMMQAFATLPGHAEGASEKPLKRVYHPLPDPAKINDHISLTENALLAVTRLQSLRVIQWMIQLGFEQDIYQPHELSNLYHVFSLACGSAADVLQNTITVVVAYQEESSVSKAQNFNLATKSELLQTRRLRLSSQAAFARGLSQVNRRHRSSLRAPSGLTDVHSKFYRFLCQQGLIPQPTLSYTTPILQYQLRIRPLLLLAHPPMLFPEDPSSINEDLHGVELLTAADKNLEEASKSMQNLLKQRVTSRALGIEGVERAWETDAKGVLRAAVGARLNVKRARDWWDTERRRNEGEPHDLSVKILTVGAEAASKGMWLAWTIPEISTVDSNA
ncbi:MAG: hypothetical protein M1828_006543 [Chrysothrix sp. TS-e1954]|nr:MAG: hypothetical protein M1828_006543 [Chrysothrix sp. TS-e1954]